MIVRVLDDRIQLVTQPDHAHLARSITEPCVGLAQPSGTRVVVAPDPFGGAEIPIAITAREIGNQPLRSEAELRRALTVASSTTLRGTVAGEPG